MKRGARTHVRAAALVAVSGLLALSAAGCKSEEPPKGPSKEEEAAAKLAYPEEPFVDDLPAGIKWPPKLDGATAVLVCVGGDRIGISEAERAAFEASFRDAFFGKMCPLTDLDAGQAQRAADRRAALGGTSHTDALASAATKYQTDWIIRCVLYLTLKPRQDPNPQISGELICSATCDIVSKAGDDVPSKTEEVRQLTNNTKKSEHREHHAGVLGRVVAKKALLSLTKVQGEAAKNTITVIFKGFQKPEHEDLGQCAKGVPGLEKDAVRTTNVSTKDEFGVVVRTNMSIEAYRDALAAKITEILSIQAEVARDPSQPSMIVVRKPN